MDYLMTLQTCIANTRTCSIVHLYSFLLFSFPFYAKYIIQL